MTTRFYTTMGQIKTYNHEQLGQVRCFMTEDGKVFFLASDVAKGLGFRDANSMTRTLDDDEKGTQIVRTPGGEQQMTVITESGFYNATMKSRVEKAKEFRRWVTKEVLPQIARTGGYIPVKEDDTPEELMARALLVAKDTIEKKDAIIAQKEAQLMAQRPKVMFADAVTSQEDSILISEMAKLLTQNGYEIGRTRLFRWLRENGYLFKHSTEPIQKWVERGIFDTHVTIINTNHGQRESITTKVTGKGQQYFINLFIR